ncbi:TadE family type IV pilus minor pilin [Streptomyces sp. NPDC059679]|uniref:TadE family type IV pilus minor pilin n=1 Tax=Streptomyces sp. NPDC059679 TaxID=3346903 RepID=UPI003686B448
MDSSDATGRSSPGSRRGLRRRGVAGPGDRGFVTAEAAVALPVLGLFALMLIWGLMAAAGQMRCVDAARAGARAAARSEPRAAALAAARSAAPRGARVELRREGDLVRVRVEARAPGPGQLAVRLHGEAVAFAEESVGRAEEAPGPAAAPAGEAGP